MSAAVAVHGLSIGWGDVTLIEDITFDIARGEIFGILGGSGSGKSTLLRYLAGLERPVKGDIDVGGAGPPDLGRGRPTAGVMFQDGALFGSMTILENTELPLKEWTGLSAGAIEIVARSKLRLVGLEAAADKLPAEVSGGMMKRAAIARALALDPRIVFFDEPQAGLDPVTAAGLDDLIVTLSRMTLLTVVMVTHQLDSIYRTLDRCLLLDAKSKGVIATGDPRELRRSDDQRVREFFNPGSKAKDRSWQPPPTT
jgi:phospholipid/cholesterol/gamma-HCH transport system ATP-binding protein